MRLQESGEMYLETIYILKKKSPYVRAIDIVNHTGYSKPSVSRAMGILKNGGYIEIDPEGVIHLTEQGMTRSQNIYERHIVLSELFAQLGVSAEVAAEDACKIEHVISEETFQALKAYLRKQKL